MSRSRRLSAGTALPAAALAAALVLTPATAFAAEGDPVATDASTTASASTGSDSTGSDSTGSDSTGSDSTGSDSTGAASTGTDSTGAAAPTTGADETGADETGPSAGDASSASGSTEGAGSGDAATPADGTTPVVVPVETAAPTAVAAAAPADEQPGVDGATLSSFDGNAHPGVAADVYADGFTPGDVVHATVTGDGVPAHSGYVSVLEPRFDEDGIAALWVLLPEDFPTGGILTVTVTDDSGRSASTDLSVREYVPAPRLQAPVGATAGVVTVTGEGGVAGGYAFVEVFDADTPLTDQFSGDPAHDEQLRTEAAEAAPAEDAPVEDAPVVEVDVEPVPYETSGYATSIVRVDAAGRFSARFVLPAGDFATDAATVDADLTNDSDLSTAVAFSVAPAVAVPAVTAPGTVDPAALPVRPAAAVTPARTTSLAYTGSEPSATLAWALGAVLAGAGALVAGRLRPRRR